MIKIKQTQIGKIPEDWEVVKLSDIGEIITGTTPSTKVKEYWGEGYQFVTPTDFSESKYVHTTERYVTQKGAKKARLIPKDSVMVTCIASVGEVSMTLKECITNQQINTIVCDKEINPHYIYYVMVFRKKILKRWAGITTSPIIKKSLFEKFSIPLPPVPEQKAIAQILSTADEAIQKSDEIIAKTEKLKKGLMQELFTKGVIFGFMFDTNIFDAILDNKISLNKILSKFNYYITHIPEDEIEAINKPENLSRKKELFEIFKELKKEEKPTETFFLGTSSLGKAKLSEKPTESAVWDISKWYKAKWGEGDLYNNLLLRLQELDRKSGKKKSEKNQNRDILIAETCIKNSLILITNDENLRTVTREFNGQAIIFEQFLKGEYKECKDSKIGKIPEDWEVVKLGKVAEYIKGKKPEEMTEEFKEGYLPYLSTEYLRSNGKTKFAKISKKIILANESDLILLWDGSNAGEFFIGKKGVLSSTMVKIRFRIEDVNRMFLFYLLKTRENYLSGQTRGTGIPHVDRSVLDSLRIPLPLFPEQKTITQILSTVDKKLKLERKRKEKFERIKKSLMNDLLTGNKRIKFRG